MNNEIKYEKKHKNAQKRTKRSLKKSKNYKSQHKIYVLRKSAQCIEWKHKTHGNKSIDRHFDWSMQAKSLARPNLRHKEK